MQNRKELPLWAQTLKLVAVVAGLGALGAYAFDLHAHVCEVCGQRWRHLGTFNAGDPSAHTCAGCGTVQWWKDGVPQVFRASIQPLCPLKISAMSFATKRDVT